MPKLPVTPWIRFLQDYRTTHAETKGSKAMSAASAQWKVLPAVERRRYEEPYQVEHKAYQTKMAEYVSSGKRDAWRRDPAKPKKPLTGFMLFLQDFRAKNASLKLTEVTQLGSAAWKGMSDAEKAPYEKRYNEAKESYEKAMKDYKASGKDEAWKKKVGLAEVAKTSAKADRAVAQAEKKQKTAEASLAKAKEALTTARAAVKSAKAGKETEKATAVKTKAEEKVAKAKKALEDAKAKVKDAKAKGKTELKAKAEPKAKKDVAKAKPTTTA